MKLVRDIMTKEVVTVPRDKLVCEAEVILCERKVSGAPVVDEDGCVVGMISLTDLNGFETTDDDSFYARVWEIASPKVVTIGPSATLSEAARMMIDKHIHRLLVVEDGETVGMLSTFDFIRLHAEGATSATGKTVASEQRGSGKKEHIRVKGFNA